MKKLLFIAAIALLAVACKKDEPAVTDDLSKEVVGSYNGYTSTMFVNIPNPTFEVDQVVTITANDDKTAKVKYVSKAWGEYVIEKANIILKGDNYLLQGKGKVMLSMPKEKEKKEYDFEFKGSIDKAKQNSSFEFKIPAVMGGVTITFTHGEAPNAIVVSGAYKGYTSTTFKYSPKPMMAADQVVKVKANEDGTVLVEYVSETWGEYKLDKVPVTLKDGTFLLEGKGKVMMGMTPESKKEYDFELKGSIDKAKQNPSFEFKIPAVMGGITITFKSGEMPK